MLLISDSLCVVCCPATELHTCACSWSRPTDGWLKTDDRIPVAVFIAAASLLLDPREVCSNRLQTRTRTLGRKCASCKCFSIRLGRLHISPLYGQHFSHLPGRLFRATCTCFIQNEGELSHYLSVQGFIYELKTIARSMHSDNVTA